MLFTEADVERVRAVRACGLLSRRNLHKPRPQSFYHADVLRSSTLVPAPRSTNDDEPLRTSAWEATVLRQGFLFSLFPKEGIGKREEPGEEVALSRRAVSYTHLTLPTKRIV